MFRLWSLAIPFKVSFLPELLLGLRAASPCGRKARHHLVSNRPMRLTDSELCSLENSGMQGFKTHVVLPIGWELRGGLLGKRVEFDGGLGLSTFRSYVTS